MRQGRAGRRPGYFRRRTRRFRFLAFAFARFLTDLLRLVLWVRLFVKMYMVALGSRAGAARAPARSLR